MRRLAAALGLFGFVVGVVSALLYHYLPLGDFGWFAYAPLANGNRGSVTFRPTWFPSLVAFPAAGLILGLTVAILMTRGGWRLVPTATAVDDTH